MRPAITMSRALEMAHSCGCSRIWPGAPGICRDCGADMAAYAELHALSNFSFLRGASHPAELITQAQALGYSALALTDECSLAGVVRAHEAVRALPDPAFRLIIGAEFRASCGLKLV